MGSEEVAIVQVMGEFELDVLAPLSPERVGDSTPAAARGTWRASAAKGGCAGRSARGRPTSGRAASIPELEPQKAQRKLAQDILSFCRLGPKDPPGHKGWTQHLATLRRRATRLTRLDLREVHVHDRGTNLRLKIAPYSMWRGGGEKDHWGRQIAMNVPTEECFISPGRGGDRGDVPLLAARAASAAA